MYCLGGPHYSSQGCFWSGYLFAYFGAGILEIGQRLDWLELGIINLNGHFFSAGERVLCFLEWWRGLGGGVLTPGYFEMCKFPSIHTWMGPIFCPIFCIPSCNRVSLPQHDFHPAFLKSTSSAPSLNAPTSHVSFDTTCLLVSVIHLRKSHSEKKMEPLKSWGQVEHRETARRLTTQKKNQFLL